jgi:hypothetical protein
VVLHLGRIRPYFANIRLGCKDFIDKYSSLLRRFDFLTGGPEVKFTKVALPLLGFSKKSHLIMKLHCLALSHNSHIRSHHNSYSSTSCGVNSSSWQSSHHRIKDLHLAAMAVPRTYSTALATEAATLSGTMAAITLPTATATEAPSSFGNAVATRAVQLLWQPSYQMLQLALYQLL